MSGFKTGDWVIWHDPDDDTCSGPGQVTEGGDGEDVLHVAKCDGGEVECLAKELTPAYNLEGRALGPADDSDDVGEAPCIFCGKKIKHFNDGGVGWMLGAVVNGETQYFLMCEKPRCNERSMTEAGLDENSPENRRVVWRCSCDGNSGYVENVGATCHDCGKPPAEVPWNDGWGDEKTN